MSLIPIAIAIFPNVPQLAGVPQLNRSPLFPPSPAPTLGTAQQGALSQSSGSAPAWGILDSDLNPLITPDSFLDFDNRSDSRVSNFPVQAGGFASYNKVQLPFEVSVRVSIGKGVGDRAQFLATLEQLKQSLTMCTVITPERSYANCNIDRYEVTRRGSSGAFFLQEVEIFFSQIIQVTAQYSTTAAATQNAQVPAAQPPINQGVVQPAAPSSAVTTSISKNPNILFSTPHSE